MATTTDTLDRWLELAIALAREAGRIQLDGLDRSPEVQHKGPRELVTSIDHACEVHIAKRLKAVLPDHGLLGEEGHGGEGKAGAPRWIVDPVDGTTNYSRRLPLFSVSIGLEVPGEGCVLGVVLAPYLDELFYARRGGGAWKVRGQAPPRRMQVAPTARLADAVLSTGFAYVLGQTPNKNLDNWAHLSPITQALRRGGSAAIDLAYVADGRFDAFWEMHLKPYDVAAGAVLVREAGGRVTDMGLGEDWLEGQTLIASNGGIHDELARELAPVLPDPWVRVPLRRQ
jgi:myo-inositol-1(or 4)-monophosphatase